LKIEKCKFEIEAGAPLTFLIRGTFANPAILNFQSSIFNRFCL